VALNQSDDFDDLGEFDEVDPFDPLVLIRTGETARQLDEDHDHRVQQHLRARIASYRRVFSTEACDQADLDTVLRDLFRFCRCGRSVNDPRLGLNDRVAAILSGRQEVGFRILDHLKLPFDELYSKYTQGE
jgi:hypothetical protein